MQGQSAPKKCPWPCSLEDAPSVTAMQTKQKTGCAMPRLEKEDPVSCFDSRLKCQTGNNLFWLTSAQGDLVKGSGNSGWQKPGLICRAALIWC